MKRREFITRGSGVAARGARKTKAVLVWEEVMPTLVGFGSWLDSRDLDTH
jgi:hypothetical protein